MHEKMDFQDKEERHKGKQYRSDQLFNIQKPKHKGFQVWGMCCLSNWRIETHPGIRLLRL